MTAAAVDSDNSFGESIVHAALLWPFDNIDWSLLMHVTTMFK